VVIYPKSVGGIVKGTASFLYGNAWAHSLHYAKKAAMPIILIGITVTERMDGETNGQDDKP
jgi:hypothetical protein